MNIFLGAIAIVAGALNTAEGIQFYKGKIELSKKTILTNYLCLSIMFLLIGLEALV